MSFLGTTYHSSQKSIVASSARCLEHKVSNLGTTYRTPSQHVLSRHDLSLLKKIEIDFPNQNPSIYQPITHTHTMSSVKSSTKKVKMSVKKVSQPPPPRSDDSDSDSVASEAVCPPVDNKKRWKGKPKWQEFGYESEADMMSDGMYAKGDQCVKCGKVFGRKYAKRLHDDRCNGTIKRCGNSKAPSKSKTAFIGKMAELTKMLDVDGTYSKIYEGLTIDAMEHYIATGHMDFSQEWVRALGVSWDDPDDGEHGCFITSDDCFECGAHAMFVGKFRKDFKQWVKDTKVKHETKITFGGKVLRTEGKEQSLWDAIPMYYDHAKWIRQMLVD